MNLVSNAKRDPSRTATLREAYSRAMRARFAKLKQLVTQTIVENDALMLGSASPDSRALPVLLQAQPAKRYQWPSDAAGKVQAFQDWLQGAIDEGILEISPGAERRIVASKSWQSTYVRAAYGRGVAQATTALRQAGLPIPDYDIAAVFNFPMHADVLALLYTRNYNELKGVTDVMGQQIARALADGLGSGVGPREIARLINARVNAIGITRATTIARSEVIHAHAEATLNRFEEYGVDGVMGEAEWSTSGDSLVCELCKDLDGKVFKLSEARGMLPRHPNCRCAWKPVIRFVGNKLRLHKLHYLN